ncbi:MAG TPA: hypothetical protein VEL07_13280 [Planctomycetota bacterium]|nr:hypothetical protein [Planctomycetota bacterium]
MSHRSALIALPLVLCAGLASSGEDHARAPWVTLTVGPGARLVERWNAGAYARWYAHDALAELRAEVDQALAEIETELGISPLAALMAATGMEARFLGMDGGQEPRAVLQVDLGLFAAPAFALLKTRIAAARARSGSTITDEIIPGADEAYSFEDGERAIVARFGQSVMVAINQDAVPAPRELAIDDADATLTIDATAIQDGMVGLAGPSMTVGALTGMMRLYGGDAVHRAWLVPEGIRLRSEQEGYAGLMVPTERALLTRFEADTTAYAAVIGLDGALIWQAAREGLLPMMGGGGDADAMEAQLDQQLAAGGFDTTIAELAAGFTGSCVLAVSQAEPYPALTLAVPRSPALDRLLSGVLEQQGLKAPAEGASVTLPLGFIEGVIARDPGHWLVASDAEPAEAWMKKRATGWSDNPAGRLALAVAKEKAASEATAISGLDLGLAVRMVTPLVQEYVLAQMPAEERAPWDRLLGDLAAEVAPEYSVSWDEDGVQVTEYRGMVGGLSGFYVGAMFGWRGAMGADDVAVAQPSLPPGGEVLRDQVFPAQIQFQAGGYCDQDGDGVGEYGLLGELAGVRGTPASPDIRLTLLGADYADGHHDGWRYAIHVPDRIGVAVREPALAGPRASDADAADAQERAWVAYAWPVAAGDGAMMYAIDQSSEIYAQPFTGESPTWNALYGADGAWGDAPIWTALAPAMEFDHQEGGLDADPAGEDGFDDDQAMDAGDGQDAQPGPDPAAVP